MRERSNEVTSQKNARTIWKRIRTVKKSRCNLFGVFFRSLAQNLTQREGSLSPIKLVISVPWKYLCITCVFETVFSVFVFICSFSSPSCSSLEHKNKNFCKDFSSFILWFHLSMASFPFCPKFSIRVNNFSLFYHVSRL